MNDDPCTCQKGPGVILIAGCLVHDECRCSALTQAEREERPCPWCEARARLHEGSPT